MAPGPRLQRLNALLHQEPFASLVYCMFWTYLLCALPAVVIVVLPMLACYRLATWLFDWNGALDFDPHHHHAEKRSTELAIVVTGCDAGFGKELALWACDAGFVVFAGCLSEDSFQQFGVQAKNGAGSIIPLLMDVTSDEHVTNAANQVSTWLQNEETKKKRILHALVNNAGISKWGYFDWLEIEDYRRVMEINFFGPLRTCKAFLPILKKQGVDGVHKRGSRILNVTSIAGLLPCSQIWSTYGPSKHAAQSFTEALREEVAGFDIQVMSINPSMHNTRMTESAVNGLAQTWEGLSPKLREEYGTDVLTAVSRNTEDYIDSLNWNQEGVVREILKLLKQREIPSQRLIGSDARYLMMPLMRMIPAWMNVMTFLSPGTVPQAMKKQDHERKLK